eukprot:Skav205727  [mRNA]  locus=scaffold1496:110537:110965:+ [translate_table: standard]
MAFLTLLLLPLVCALPVSQTLPSEVEALGAPINLQAEHDKDKHEHEKHEDDEDAKVDKVEKSPQHWWSRFWPFLLPGTPKTSDVADVQLDERHRHEAHGDHERDEKSAVQHPSETSHWWDHLWPFALSEDTQISQLNAEDRF